MDAQFDQQQAPTEQVKPLPTGEVIWDLNETSAALKDFCRAPHSLAVDDNNTLYVGTNGGLYIMSMKKIANKKNFLEDYIDINNL